MKKLLSICLAIGLFQAAQAQLTISPADAVKLETARKINGKDFDGTANISTGIPVTSKSANYTTVLADANTAFLHPSTDNNARTFTIDSNANVAYTVGDTLTFINEINTVTIAITSDTLTLQGANTTGSRTLAAGNTCTALKVSATKWIITGSSGLTWVLPPEMFWLLAA